MINKWLYRYSIVVVMGTFLLVLAGGLVTSHDAGLAVPDWPTSYGQWFPPMVGNIFWEHGHRMIAGSVGILTLILTLWIHFKEKRKGLRILGWITLGSVVAQAVLGGLTVLFLLPDAVSIAHACLAQTFFCMVIAIFYFLSPFQNRFGFLENERLSSLSSIRRLMILTFVFIYCQLLLGAIVRHSGQAIAFHILLAFILLLHGILLVVRVLSDDSLKKLLTPVSMVFGIFLVLQIFLGIGSWIVTRSLESGYAPSQLEVFFTATHQTVGAIILGSCFFMLLKVEHGLRIKSAAS